MIRMNDDNGDNDDDVHNKGDDDDNPADADADADAYDDDDVGLTLLVGRAVSHESVVVANLQNNDHIRDTTHVQWQSWPIVMFIF